MDAIDREIVRTVQHDARISYRDLGRAVGLSPNAAADRLRRLLRSGVLRILAVVDPGADVRLRVLIDVQLRQDQSDDAFEAAIRDLLALANALARADSGHGRTSGDENRLLMLALTGIMTGPIS